MPSLEDHFRPRHLWFYRYVLAPTFGTSCFLVGAVGLFVISLGRWRVRSWPRFDTESDRRLEPSRAKVGSLTYFCADAAMLAGFVILLGTVFAGVGIWSSRS